jgi:hypothetical protein
LKQAGLGLSDNDAANLFSFFDHDRSGVIGFDEFVLALRGKMNEFRKKLVIQAFNNLDINKRGDLTIGDLKNKFDATKHPDVKAGKKRSDDVLAEFVKTFELVYDYHVNRKKKKPINNRELKMIK